MALVSPRFAANGRLQAAAQNAPPMKSGEKGEPVAILQQALIDAGFPMPISTAKAGRPDGIYGNETATTVWKFQAKHKLQTDGVAGHDTLHKLDELFPASTPGKELRFEELFSPSGFDESTSPPSLFVPVHRFVNVRLRNSDGATLTSDNMGVAQAEHGLVPNRAAIFGRSGGKTVVHAKKGSSTADLNVVVRHQKIVTVKFYVITDKNNISPSFTNRKDGLPNVDRESQIPALLSDINQIYGPQANIQFVQVDKTQRLNIFRDLDPFVLPDHESVITREITGSAMYHVFFVRDVTSREVGAAELNGVTKIGDRWTVMGNRGDATTLAHEAGHSRALGGIGRNHDPANRHMLMFCSKRRSGAKIPISQVDIMNP